MEYLQIVIDFGRFEVSAFESFLAKGHTYRSQGQRPWKMNLAEPFLAKGHIQSTRIAVEYGRWPKTIVDFHDQGRCPWLC